MTLGSPGLLWYDLLPFQRSASFFYCKNGINVGRKGLSSAWERVLGALENHIARDQINEWLLPLEYLPGSGKTLKLKAPSDLHKEWIQENYLDEIDQALAELDTEVRRAEVVLAADEPSPTAVAEPAEETQSEQREHAKLNPKYLFDSFVVGSSNQFAHAASRAVAETPSSTYNPLYIYGSSGLGKTHLLHAIAHRLLEGRPNLEFCYTTCEEFTNQFINSIRFNKGEVFRERYRSVDVLLIDDIQFLSGKTQTQEEFFHTFNSLFEQQKQIILSSDVPPSEIPKLEDRLTSRFSWGLIADIQPPALETRVAILKKKSEAESVHLSDDVVLYIASKVKSNVRELEGALVKLLAYASLGNRAIDVDLAEQCLRNYVKEENAQISCDKIKKLIADKYSLKISELSIKSNAKRIAQPRQIAMYLTRQLTPMSLPEIGQAFGNKHHSTVLYSIQKVTDLMNQSNEYSTMIRNLEKALG